MAYQNIGTPRFYINIVEWLNATGAKKLPDDVLYNNILAKSEGLLTLPVSPQPAYSWYFNGGVHGMTENGFIAFLGHRMKSVDTYFSFYALNGVPIPFNELIVNCELDGPYAIRANYDGFTIATFEGTVDIQNFYLLNDTYDLIGSTILGSYYDMPNAPNLSLTMSRDYGKTNEITTHNGSSISNNMWNKPPMWGDLGAWELEGSATQELSRGGRRSWDLKFSYMDDGDLWGANQSLSKTIITSTDIEAGDINTGYPDFNDNILTDDNFFSQVWHKTLGGTLPFIFQPDAPVLNETTGEYEGGNNNPDQFAICRFVDNSLKATQSAFNVYDISLSIEEAW